MTALKDCLAFVGMQGTSRPRGPSSINLEKDCANKRRINSVIVRNSRHLLVLGVLCARVLRMSPTRGGQKLQEMSVKFYLRKRWRTCSQLHQCVIDVLPYSSTVLPCHVSSLSSSRRHYAGLSKQPAETFEQNAAHTYLNLSIETLFSARPPPPPPPHLQVVRSYLVIVVILTNNEPSLSAV